MHVSQDDGKSEKFCKFFLELNKAQIPVSFNKAWAGDENSSKM